MELEHVDVIDFLSALEIRNISGDEKFSDEIQFSCPFPVHGYGDSTPSAYMNARTTAFYCHSCKAAGNAIHFLARLENIAPLLAARYIRERYGDGFVEPGGGFVVELDELLQPPSVPPLVTNDKIHYQTLELSGTPLEYMRGRGFKDKILETWEIGYDPISDRIAIPVWDYNGTLIGFKGRAYKPDHKPKYLVLGDREGRSARYGFPTYNVSDIVFGLNYCDHLDGRLIIVEGELNVIALSQHGISNGVAVGSNFGNRKRDLILASADSVCLFLDNDVAGLAATAKIADALAPYLPVFDVGLHEGDPATLTSDECATLIEGAKNINEKWLPEKEEL